MNKFTLSFKDNYKSKYINLFKINMFSLLILLCFTNNSLATESCVDDQSVCVSINQKSNYSSEVVIKNKSTFQKTVSINFDPLTNLKTSVKMPYNITVVAHKTLKAFDLIRINISEEYRYNYKFYTVEGIMSAKHDNNYIYSLPYKSGESYKIIQGFNGKYTHVGEQKYALDFGLPQGTEIRAARDGVVVGIKSDSSTSGWGEKYAKFANYIYVQHSDGTFGGYIHLKKDGVKVELGQKVKVGDIIGLSGNTGWTDGPHLHFWVYKA
ncbi:MAG: M23 family metallopeptidase, partial [Candidatus Sericytochromatia bacterium]|nr:M23 family metallopeptidase [Candidatus Sericytochromatia bacterium]